MALAAGAARKELEDAMRAQAADDGRARRGINGLASGADGDFAVIAEADAGMLTPDKGSPRAGGDGAQLAAFFGERVPEAEGAAWVAGAAQRLWGALLLKLILDWDSTVQTKYGQQDGRHESPTTAKRGRDRRLTTGSQNTAAGRQRWA